MLVSDFHFDLPEGLIAQEPLADRAGSRLLRVDPTSGKFEDCGFRGLPEILRPDDLLVFNNTRVFPARLYGRRGGSAQPHFSQRTREMGHPGANPAAREFLRGRVEVLLTKQLQQEPNEWECLVRPGRKIGVGEQLFFGEQDELQAEVVGRGEFGERRIRFAVAGVPGSARPDSREAALSLSKGRVSPHEHLEADPHEHAHSSSNEQIESGSAKDFFSLVEKIGHVPLPPYITREDSAGARERYQTVYARDRGSVAAPTAGLHFTPEILARIRERGIETAEVTLHVGLGTFQPVRVERVEEHRLHSERYSVSEDAARKINLALKQSRRVVAVGTTTVRTLEFAAQSGEVRAGAGEANLFIYPGYKFRVVRGLLTNFHLPQSTLLMMVCALGGKENVLRAYAHAVEQRYRFYSYGDCMLVE
jgi:S-adenosylmethionine:tRNA ribosyltransferase-isomerase